MNTRVKMKIWNVTALTLLLVGLILIFYPKWVQYVEQQRELHLLTEWDAIPKESSYADNLAQPLLSKASLPTSDVRTPEPAPDPEVMIDGIPLYGAISIEKIDLREPMLAGATAQSLKHGSGVVVPNRTPGTTGNFVLASHRSQTFGRHFNRLDELEAGDEIKIETTNNTYVYKVNTKFIVEPEDLSVLDQNKDDKQLTLITCEPMDNPTHRLIIKALLGAEK
ncbi:class D sortase [Paenibacillus sp. OSY-SE]|uniref:class D sortase n=1 Tax=Paenibacillus sp. OSY-SE TaxID=1196323 RepID=UPI000310859F|nr:class D sortase [Paenibacillus sp. OSY-SE]